MTSVASRQEHDSGDYSDSFHQENEPDNSGNDGGQLESDYESAGSDSERSRDQDTQEIERRVDDDEDRSNPQYIPKRGTFYEHDDRTAASVEESNKPTSETAAEKREGTETPSERRRPPRKSDTNKWAHDKYNENEQAPKSRDELVAIYGYDIRNEDAPPHARRNRRYGRGPNKYTRTWEDEEAYKRQAAAAPAPRKPPTAEDFPELDARNNYNSKKRIPRPRSKSQPSSNESVENGVPLRRNASTKVKKAPQNARAPVVNRTPRQNDRNNSKDKMPAIENLTITATVINSSQGAQVQRKANVNVAQQRPVPTEQAKKKPQPVMQPPIQNNVALNKPPPQQNQQPPSQPQKQQISNQQPQQQMTGPESRGGSKRYSSLRQRPIDTYCPPQNQQQPPPQQPQLIPQQQQQQQQQQQPQLQQQQSQQIISQQQQQSQLQAQQQAQQQIYLSEYPSGPNQAASQQPSAPAQIHPQQMMQQMHRNVTVSQPSHGPSPPHQHPQQMQHSQQVRIGIIEQQQLVQHPHHSIHNMQQQHIGQLQQPQGYAPPAMMPAQYMQQPQASGAVFGAAPIYAQPPAPYPHQMYNPHHNYAQAGGVTYFTCAEQEQPRTQRRPTAAIPIVKPQASERQVNSSEKDNIDRIVENMFVRKPWPASHGADSKEGKSEARSSQEPPSKESSQPNSLTSSSISTDSKPSEPKEEVKELKEVNEIKEITEVKEVREVREEDRDTNESEGVTEGVATQDSISTEA